MNYSSRFTVLSALLILGACATVPNGPSLMALPGTGKNFDQFRGDDLNCRQYASVQIGGTTPNQAASDSGVKSAAVGTILGAAAGGVIDGGSGAAIGAGIGLLAGAISGSGAGSASAYDVQQRYDYSYIQCMYAKGHKVPVSGRFASSPPGAPPPGPPPPGPYTNLPPPPPPR